MIDIRTHIASLVAALLLVPAASVLAAEPSQVTEPSSAAEPAPAAQTPAAEEPAAQEKAAPPAATPAQSPEDVSGGNEYTESGPPTATGQPEEPDTPDTDQDAGGAPTQSAPVGGGDDTGSEVAASDTAGEATDEAADGLPRTGVETLILALMGIALVGCGTLLRRAAAQQR